MTSPEHVAAVVPIDTIARTRGAILEILDDDGAMTEQGIIDAYHRNWYRHGSPRFPRVTDAAIRARLAELVDGGLVLDTGERHVTESGREAVVWR